MDITLHYEQMGEGFPLVLLHGNGEDHTYFQHQMEPFAAHYRVIALDTRGHGGSPRGEAPFTLEQFAQDLKDFLDEQGIEKCHLVALIFALKYPQYIEKLVLCGANLEPEGLKSGLRMKLRLRWAALQAARHVQPELERQFELLDLMVTQPHIDHLALRGLRMPVLVVAGDHDMIYEAHTRMIAAPIPHGKLAILPGDHFVARDNWKEFNPLVLDFLQKD